MDIKDFPSIIVLFLFIGMLVGIGILTIDEIGDASRESTAVSNEAVNLSTANSSVSLTYDEIDEDTTITVTNSSGTAYASTKYTIGYTAGTITRTGASQDSTGIYNVTYNYWLDIDATTAMDDVNDAISAIPSTWMTLIVTVLVLAIIMGFIIKTYSGR